MDNCLASVKRRLKKVESLESGVFNTDAMESFIAIYESNSDQIISGILEHFVFSENDSLKFYGKSNDKLKLEDILPDRELENNIFRYLFICRFKTIRWNKMEWLLDKLNTPR